MSKYQIPTFVTIVSAVATISAAGATAWLAWATRDLAAETQKHSRQLKQIATQLVEVTAESRKQSEILSLVPQLLEVANCETETLDETTFEIQRPDLCRNLRLRLFNGHGPDITSQPRLRFSVDNYQGVCDPKNQVDIPAGSEGFSFFNIRSCLQDAIGQPVRRPVRFVYVAHGEAE